MQTIIVDMTPGFRMPTIYYSQGDVGTQFAIDLRSRFGDSFPAGTTVTIQATKPSGFGFSVAATSVTNGVATFTTTAEMTDEFGRFPAELKVTKTGLTLFTANFYMDGERNTHPEGTTDGSQETVIPELTQLVERVEDAASSVLDMTVVANTLPAGSDATYSYDEETNTATFGIPKGADGSLASGVLAPTYSSSSTYAVGDYVYYSGSLYRCTTAITTAEAWTSGHWTQVALAPEVSDLKSDLSFEYDTNGVPAQHLSVTDFTSNVIYKADGSTQVYGGNWKSTEFIPCSGADIEYKAHAYYSIPTDIAYVAFFDMNKQMTHCLKSSDAGGDGTNKSVTGTTSSQAGDYYVRVVTFTTTTPDAYLDVKASGIYPSVASASSFETRLGAVENEIGTDGTAIYYANFDSTDILRENGTFNDYGAAWKSTGYVNCKGVDSIFYKATAFNGNGVNKIAYVAFFDDAHNIISMLKSSDVGANKDVTGTEPVPVGATCVRVVGTSATCYVAFNTSGLKQFDYFKVSDLNVLCIGDSLTRGVINSDTDIILESYPYWVGKILSSTVSNAGYPGGQPDTWWARKGNYDQPTPSTDLVLIMFGTNGGLDVNTLATDVEPYNDYADYANTGVGCMCKIIEWIMEESTNHAQIILMTPPHSTFSNAQETRVVNSEATIRAIAKRYALPVIDVLNESGMNIYNGSTFRPSDGCHFSAKGYHKLGSFVAHQVASMYSTFDNSETGTIIS